MAVREHSIFERFLAPIFKTFLINEEELLRFYKSIDWDGATARLSNPTLTYPTYYSKQNFHGIEGGYLNVNAAISYDPITQYALPPSEAWVRQAMVDAIQARPRRILDLGCGTGSSTILLKQAFPQAEVFGIDLSPYMLVVAENKAQKAGLDIQWRHANAEQTGFPADSFDLITISLLFHETPPAVSRKILRECHRLLTVGGEVIVLDGSQKILRQTEWLTQIFEEPYIHAYAAESIDAWMGGAGFGAVQTQDVWLVHQWTRGVKPKTQPLVETELFADLEAIEGSQWAVG